MLLVLCACGGNAARISGSPAAAIPSPVLPPTEYERQLLTDLQAIKLQLFETPVLVAPYVFEGAGLDYDKRVFGLYFGGLDINEWNAPDLDPSSGVCKADDGFMDRCGLVGTTGKGLKIYVGQSPVFPEAMYMRVGATGFSFHQGGLRTIAFPDLKTLADSLAPVTPHQVIDLNRKAAEFAQHLHDTASQLIDFKTYLPQKNIQNFQLDKKGLSSRTDPLHPYLWMHFQRTSAGNQAFEFTASEFRDDIPLTVRYCGKSDPELGYGYGEHDPCAFLFATPKGTKVYSSIQTMRFDIGSTRVVFLLDMTIHQLTQSDVTQFVDSFVAVPPQSLI